MSVQHVHCLVCNFIHGVNKQKCVRNFSMLDKVMESVESLYHTIRSNKAGFNNFIAGIGENQTRYSLTTVEDVVNSYDIYEEETNELIENYFTHVAKMEFCSIYYRNKIYFIVKHFKTRLENIDQKFRTLDNRVRMLIQNGGDLKERELFKPLLVCKQIKKVDWTEMEKKEETECKICYSTENQNKLCYLSCNETHRMCLDCVASHIKSCNTRITNNTTHYTCPFCRSNIVDITVMYQVTRSNKDKKGFKRRDLLDSKEYLPLVAYCR